MADTPKPAEETKDREKKAVEQRLASSPVTSTGRIGLADGRTLAFIARQGNSFKLHTLDLSSPGSQPVPLTDTTDDESPSFSPNGKLIIYATRAGGRDVLMTTTLDGKIKARLVSTTADVREPNWSPYGR